MNTKQTLATILVAGTALSPNFAEAQSTAKPPVAGQRGTPRAPLRPAPAAPAPAPAAQAPAPAPAPEPVVSKITTATLTVRDAEAAAKRHTGIAPALSDAEGLKANAASKAAGVQQRAGAVAQGAAGVGVPGAGAAAGAGGKLDGWKRAGGGIAQGLGIRRGDGVDKKAGAMWDLQEQIQTLLDDGNDVVFVVAADSKAPTAERDDLNGYLAPQKGMASNIMLLSADPNAKPNGEGKDFLKGMAGKVFVFKAGTNIQEAGAAAVYDTVLSAKSADKLFSALKPPSKTAALERMEPEEILALGSVDTGGWSAEDGVKFDL